MGVARDCGRRSRETAAGAGLGISRFSDRMAQSALIGAPLLDENRAKLGDPLVQAWLDLKGW